MRGILVVAVLLVAACVTIEARHHENLPESMMAKHNGTSKSKPKKTKTGSFLTCDQGCLPDMWCDANRICQYSVCGGGFSCPGIRPVCGADGICRVGAGGGSTPTPPTCGVCSPGTTCVAGRCVTTPPATPGGLLTCQQGCAADQDCQNGVCVNWTCGAGIICPASRSDLACNTATGRCVLKNTLPPGTTPPAATPPTNFLTCQMGCKPDQDCQNNLCVSWTCGPNIICPTSRSDLACNTATGMCVLKNTLPPGTTPPATTPPTNGGFLTCQMGCKPEQDCQNNLCVSWSCSGGAICPASRPDLTCDPLTLMCVKKKN